VTTHDVQGHQPDLVRRYLGQRRSPARENPAVRADRDRPLPLSDGQRRLWALEQLRPGAEYLVPLALRIRGELDVPRLCHALDAVVARHEILRTRYLDQYGQPFQVVDPPRPVMATLLDVRDRADGLEALLAAEGTTAFDLSRAWPLRATLAQLGHHEHLLLLVFHHIAFDGWSAEVLLDDIAAFYSNRPVEPLTLQYADVAAVQQERDVSGSADADVDYWLTTLSGLRALSLPTDRPRPPTWQPEGDVVTFRILAPVATGALRAGADCGATPFATLLAAFWALLGRYGGTADVAVGTPVADRTRPEYERMIGFFVNTLVLRGDVGPDRSFAELVTQAQNALLDGYQHQDVPFERVVRELAVARDPALPPVYQAMMTCRDGQQESRRLGGLTINEESVDWAPARVDLALDLTLCPDGGLDGAIVYPTALFEPDTVRRFAGHLSTFLAAAGERPEAPIGTLDLLDPAERARLLVAFNNTEVNRPAWCLPDRMAVQAATKPDAVAVRDEATVLTYSEFAANVHQLAHFLGSLGVGPESRVAVCLPRSASTVVALHATVTAGAAYIPVDPDYPRERVRNLIADACPHVVLTDRANARLVAGDARVVCLDEIDLTGYPTAAPRVGLHPDNAAYVIYTSGSTGHPKGAVISHRAIANRLDWMQARYGLTAEDVVLQKTPLGFDVSVWELFWPLSVGAALVVAAPDGHRDPEYLRDLIVRQHVTVCHFVPSMLRAFLNIRSIGRCGSLRDVICSGEALPVDLVRRFHGVLSARLHNLYGPTETAVDVSSWECHAGESGPRTPIGDPIDNIRLYVLDTQIAPVPIGLPGELFIGGAGLARGYHGRPGQTAAAFIPDPHGSSGGRLYRTGDIVRWTAAGSLDYLCRSDFQVKIRGHRVEPGEVEAMLAQHPAVGTAVVTADLSDASQPRLIAYLVPAGEDVPEPVALRAWLAQRLPAPLVPAWFVTLDALPVSANGKLDRSALPAPQVISASGTYVPPRGACEAAIAEVWADVLRADRIGAQDSFFDFGGDSIRALRAVGQLRARGFDVTVQDILRHPSPAALASLITGRPSEAAPEGTAENLSAASFSQVSGTDRKLVPEGVTDVYPLGQVQAGMLYEMLADEQVRPYHNYTDYLIRDDAPFSLSALQAATRAVTARHDILRTAIDLTTYSAPMQVVWSVADIPVTVEDLTGRSAEEQERTRATAVRHARGSTFDLDKPALVRLRVQVLSASRWRLGWLECHALIDGWSHNSLVSELVAAYRAARDGRSLATEPVTPSRFADFVALERIALASDEHRAFWAGRLAKSEPASLPGAWATSGDGEQAPYDIELHVDDLLPRLRDLARTAGTPLKSVLLAAHVKVMSLSCNEGRFRVGLAVNGRPEIVGGDLVWGNFLNIVPFSIDVAAPTWRALVRAVYAEETALWPYRRYPAPAMARKWSPDNPLIEVLFNYLDFHNLDTCVIDQPSTGDHSPTEFALVVSTVPGTVVLSFAPRRVGRAWGERLADIYHTVLTAMAADPDGHPHSPLLPPAEFGGHERPVSFDHAACGPVHALCAARAAAAPDTVALVGADVMVTYGELEARANQLAHRLRERDVRPGAIVGICLDRSVELIVAMLAILKADGAYFGLDPDDPRRARLFTVAGASLVLTADPSVTSIGGIPAVTLDSLDPAGASATPPVTRAVGTDLAYLIHTSGSSGEPKIVGVPHCGVVRLVVGQEYAAFGPGETYLHHSPVTFDAATFEIWGALANGGRLVIARPGPLDIRDVREYIGQYGITTMWLTTALFRLIVTEDATVFLPLRRLLTGGELVQAEDVAKLRRAAPGVHVTICYGPTETTTFATVNVLAADEPLADPLPIGEPIADTQAYVLDHDGCPAAAGVTGELYLGGPGVARGYVAQPAMTAAQFVPDPFAGAAGGRLYRTGDRAYWLPGRGILFAGRIDSQVKISGHRIEPGEVEVALRTHADIDDATAVAHEFGPGDKRLVAYLVSGNGSLGLDEVHDHLRGILPDYLLPRAVVLLDELPLTTSGKVNRQALPAPQPQRTGLRRRYVAPKKGVEATIAAVWADLLGIDRVGVTDDFYELGGHSLLAMRAAAVLTKTHGLPVDTAALLGRRTIAELVRGMVPAEPAIGPGAAMGAGAAVWLRVTGGQAPYVLIHPGGGSVHWYRELAALLPPEHPVLALQHPGLADEDKAALPIGALAEIYAAAIRAAQPDGPYHIFGWCSGAAVTLEVTRQLQEGEAKVSVALLDPTPPSDEPPEHLVQLRRAAEVISVLVDPAKRHPPRLRSEAVALLAAVVEGDSDAVPGSAEEIDEAWLSRVRIWRDVSEAVFAYVPESGSVSPARILLSNEMTDDGHEAMGGRNFHDYLATWNRIAGCDVPVTRLDGTHLGLMVQPHVNGLAEGLRQWMAG
jgi:amino acid adenylation domain-containing protein